MYFVRDCKRDNIDIIPCKDKTMAMITARAIYNTVSVHDLKKRIVEACHGTETDFDVFAHFENGYDMYSEISIIEHFQDKICETMKECYRDVLESGGNCCYSIYIDEIGEIVTEMYAGSHAMRWMTDDYYHVVDVFVQHFNPADFSENGEPDEKEIDEIIDGCIEYYDSYDILRGVIDDLERDRDYCFFDPNF